MYGAVIHAPGDVRFEERADPTLKEPTDAIVRTVATCVCGSDLWRYRGIAPVSSPTPIGHEYCGIVEQIGSVVTTVQPCDFVVGGFTATDNTCPVCAKGAQANCLHRSGYDGAQAELIRIPWADGTLIATPAAPDASPASIEQVLHVRPTSCSPAPLPPPPPARTDSVRTRSEPLRPQPITERRKQQHDTATL